MVRWSVGLLWLALLCAPSLASAENYVALGVGINAPTFDTTDAGKVALEKDLYYGGKIGHYFNDRGFNWFGLEIDAYRSTPSIKQQTLPTNSNPRLSGTIPGADLLVHSLAFNALVRVTGYQYKVEPYAGLGLGLNQTGSLFCAELQHLGRHQILRDAGHRPLHRIQIQLRPVLVLSRQHHRRLPRQPVHVRHRLPFRTLGACPTLPFVTRRSRRWQM
ncbi:MAG: hypothetical protein CV089_21075 [Nitrospira sp. WS110]|nr:hypothetical protein [Nitrospira sp. WS110]